MSKRNKLDKYYTNINKIKKIIGRLNKNYFYIEPSAGDGAFIEILKEKGCEFKAYDLAPNHKDIEQKDFFNVTIEKSSKHTKTIVIGNPPFGKNSSLAIKFFNHAASFEVDEIRFIVPKTFKKTSVQNRLNKYYHLVKTIDLPYKSFILDGEEYDVPSCWQIWKRKSKERKIKKTSYSSKYFEFTTKENSELSIRRVGGRAGELLLGNNHSVSSTYFLKILDKGIIDIFASDNYYNKIKQIRNNTAGVRSISKQELISITNKLMEEVKWTK